MPGLLRAPPLPARSVAGRGRRRIRWIERDPTVYHDERPGSTLSARSATGSQGRLVRSMCRRCSSRGAMTRRHPRCRDRGQDPQLGVGLLRDLPHPTSRSASGICRSSETGSRSTTDVLRYWRPPLSRRLLAKAATQATYREVSATRRPANPGSATRWTPLVAGRRRVRRAAGAQQLASDIGAGAQVFGAGHARRSEQVVLLIGQRSSEPSALPGGLRRRDSRAFRVLPRHAARPPGTERGRVQVDRDGESGEIVFRSSFCGQSIRLLASACRSGWTSTAGLLSPNRYLNLVTAAMAWPKPCTSSRPRARVARSNSGRRAWP